MSNEKEGLIGSNNFIVSGKEIKMDVPAKILGERTFISAEALVENVLDKNVNYQEDIIIVSLNPIKNIHQNYIDMLKKLISSIGYNGFNPSLS